MINLNYWMWWMKGFYSKVWLAKKCEIHNIHALKVMKRTVLRECISYNNFVERNIFIEVCMRLLNMIKSEYKIWSI
jgi:hypothetical protein